MKKKIFFILILAGFSLLFCSYARQRVVKVRGSVRSYGNVPFNFPGIVTEDGKVYKVIADKEVQDTLLTLGGELIEFKGIIVEDAPVIDTLDDGAFELHSYKVKK